MTSAAKETFIKGDVHNIMVKNLRLIQEDYVGDAWKVLVASLFLKRTTGRQVRPVLKKFFEVFPKPTLELSKGRKLEDIEEIIRSLGLWRKRAKEISNIAMHLYTFGDPKTKEKASLINGVGEYVANAYAIFVLGDLTVKPNDEKLRYYLDRVEGGEKS